MTAIPEPLFHRLVEKQPLVDQVGPNSFVFAEKHPCQTSPPNEVGAPNGKSHGRIQDLVKGVGRKFLSVSADEVQQSSMKEVSPNWPGKLLGFHC